MGASNEFKSMEREQRFVGNDFVPVINANLFGGIYKRIIKMAETKMMWAILNAIGFPIYLLGILQNLDNIKSVILILLGVIWGIIRIYFSVVWGKQKTRMRELEIRKAEKELSKN